MLLSIPARVRFLSWNRCCIRGPRTWSIPFDNPTATVGLGAYGNRLDGIHWTIIGGESGPHARPMDVAWIQSLADQCQAAGVAVFVKQDSGRFPGKQGRLPDALWNLKQFPAP